MVDTQVNTQRMLFEIAVLTFVGHVDAVNDLLKRCEIPKQIQRLSDCSPSMFVLVVENILDEHLEGVVRNPKSSSDNIHNMELVLIKLAEYFPNDTFLRKLNAQKLYVERTQRDIATLIDLLMMLVNASHSSSMTIAYHHDTAAPHRLDSIPTNQQRISTPLENTTVISASKMSPIKSSPKKSSVKYEVRRSPLGKRRSKQHLQLDPQVLREVAEEASDNVITEHDDEEQSEVEYYEESENEDEEDEYEEDSNEESEESNDEESESEEEDGGDSEDEVMKNILYEAYKRAKKKKITDRTRSLNASFEYSSAPVSRRTSSSNSRSSGSRSFKSDIIDEVQGMSRKIDTSLIQQKPIKEEIRRHSAPMSYREDTDKEREQREKKMRDRVLMPPPSKRIMAPSGEDARRKESVSQSSSASSSPVTDYHEDDENKAYWKNQLEPPTLKTFKRSSSAPKRTSSTHSASKRLSDSVSNVEKRMFKSPSQKSPYNAPLIGRRKPRRRKAKYTSMYTEEMIRNSPALKKYYKLYKQHLADYVDQTHYEQTIASKKNNVRTENNKLDDIKFSKFQEEQERILFARLLDMKIQEENEIKKVYRMVMSLEKERMLSEKNQLKEAEKEFERKATIRVSQIDK
jgi:hypothetical protein